MSAEGPAPASVLVHVEDYDLDAMLKNGTIEVGTKTKMRLSEA